MSLQHPTNHHISPSRYTIFILLLFFCFALIITIPIQCNNNNKERTPSPPPSPLKIKHYFESRQQGQQQERDSNSRGSSRVFRAKANTRFQSAKPVDFSLTRSTQVNEVFLYDATLNYHTINIDMHPYIHDVGCLDDWLFIRISIPSSFSSLQWKEEYLNVINELKRDFAIGNLLVSSLNGFKCKTSNLLEDDDDTTTIPNEQQSMNNQVLYRLITQSTLITSTSSITSTHLPLIYFQISTVNIPLSSVFSNLQLISQKPPNKHSQHSRTWQGKTGNGYLFANTNQLGGPATSMPIFLQGPPVTISCKNCYMTVGLGFSFAINFPMWKFDYIEGTLNYDIDFNMQVEIDLEHSFEVTYPILVKTPFFTVQYIWVIPICLVMSAQFDFILKSNARANSVLSLKYNRVGSSGFKFHDNQKYYPIDYYTGGFPKFGFELNSLEGNVQASLRGTLSVSIFTILGLDYSIQPNLKAVVSTSPTCLLSYDTYFSLDSKIKVLPIIVLGYQLIGAEFDLPLIQDIKIQELSGVCIPNFQNRRSMNSLVALSYLKDVNSCCGVSLNDTKTIVGTRVIVDSDNFKFHDGIILNLEYTGSCYIIYGNEYHNRTFQTSTTSVYITFNDLILFNTTEIRVIFQKMSTEIVTLQYSFFRNSIVYSKETRMRDGLLLFDIPEKIPDFLAFKIDGGILRQQNGELVPNLLDTKQVNFPLFLSFEGEGTITVYPFYNLYSGMVFKSFIGNHLRFGICYKSSQVSNLLFDSLKMMGEVSTRSGLPIYDINVQISSFDVFDIDRVHNMTSTSSFSSLQFTRETSLMKYIIFDVKGNVELDLILEFLEIYKKHLSSDFLLNYSSMSTFSLKLTNNEFSGLVMSIDESTHAFLSTEPIFESNKQFSIWKSVSPKSDIFGFSHYSNSELIGKILYIRYEPRNLVLLKQSVGESQQYGSIQFSKLQSTNISVEIKYSDKHGQYMDNLYLNDLTIQDHTYYLNIIILNSQYTFNQIALSSLSTFISFLNSIQSLDNEYNSKWNQFILPTLSYQAANHQDFSVELINPQILRIKLPTYPKLESSAFEETIQFTHLETSVFTPQPAHVIAMNTLKVSANQVLSGGEIGTIIASFIAFLTIFILLSIIMIMIIIWMTMKLKRKN